MRTYASIALFILASALVACGGGGGGSHVLPATSGGGGSNTGAPSTTKTTRANISLYVPPINKQNSRKPFYISSSTQSFGVFVEAYPSVLPSIGPSSTPPPGMQVFPVATPSPCAAASAGGYTCTFTVTAPIGTDLFVVAAFAQASPNASAAPLSAFLSGPTAVGGSASPSPLAFTLNGVVNSVAVSVNSPDPGNTPNTQVFTVGVPTGAPIGITAFDSSGNIIMSDPTTPYFNPIVIQASPASDGLTFSLINTSSCGSSASGSTASIACSGDLGNVQVAYDGTPRPDPSDHLIDQYSVYSTTAPNPTPSPANFVLQSNELNYSLIPSYNYAEAGYLMRAATGKLVYISQSDGIWDIGTFDPGTATAGAYAQMTTAESIQSAALAPNGDVWVDDGGPLDCYSESGGSAVVSGLYPQVVVVPTSPPVYDTVYPSAITVDASGNLWYTGYDSNTGTQYAGYFNVSAGCSSTIPNPIIPQFTLNGDSYDDSANLSAIPTGGVVMGTGQDTTPNIYVMSTGSSSPISPLPAMLSGAYESYGVAGDNAGNAYAGFSFDPGTSDVESTNGSAVNTVMYLPPSPSPAPLVQPEPSGGLNAFSVSGAADRLTYVDTNYAALGIVESVQTSPMPILVSLPDGYEVYAAAYNKNGGEYVLNTDGSGNLNLTRALPTRTWSVANLNLNGGCNNVSMFLTVLERGDSGPFAVTASGATVTQFPNADHDFWLSFGSPTGSFTVQVTDAHGRSEAYPVTATEVGCGLAHRHPSRVHPRPTRRV